MVLLEWVGWGCLKGVKGGREWKRGLKKKGAEVERD